MVVGRRLLFVTKINPAGLIKAMDLAGCSRKRLADATDLRLQYVCDVVAGRRNLAHSPGVRNAMAKALDVPVHWIEQDAA